jgi:hypothetical protein
MEASISPAMLNCIVPTQKSHDKIVAFLILFTLLDYLLLRLASSASL